MHYGQVLGASLQWGRVLMNAETQRLPSLCGLLVPLQWGRVLMNAETWHRSLSFPIWIRFNGAAFS